MISVISRAEATAGKVLVSGTVAVKPNGTTPITVAMPKMDPRLAGKTEKGLLTVTSEPAGISVCMVVPLKLEPAQGILDYSSLTP